MTPLNVILCGGVRPPGEDSRLTLDLSGPAQNVTLHIDQLGNAVARNIPLELVDLLEVASYIYCADQLVSRGGRASDDENWHRQLRMHIPVRVPALWSRPEIKRALGKAVWFATADAWTFEFSQLATPPPVQQYLGDLVPTFSPEAVILFSGGLDSLAGALDATLTRGKRVALVSHSSATKVMPQVAQLAAAVGQKAGTGRTFHVPVRIEKAESLTKDYTQRARSFVYASLAAVVARLSGLDRIAFCENGVTSFHLPVSAQVVSSRAARTTHPQTMEGYARLFSLLFDRTFSVDTPFLWKTKTDIVKMIQDHGCSPLIRDTVSCSRAGYQASVEKPHCGKCSQCVDRRIATIAAGVPDEDEPADSYRIDLLAGARAPGEERAMIEGFLWRARAITTGSDLDLFKQFPEATRLLNHVGLPPNEAARRLHELHERHGRDVFAAVNHGVKKHAAELTAGALPDTCMIVLALPERYRSGGDRANPPAPTFRLEDDHWRVWFQNEQTILKDGVGPRRLVRILASPDVPIPPAELIAVDVGNEATFDASELRGTSGDASDSQAVADYRKRVVQIKAELRGDLPEEAKTKLRLEKEQIEEHLDSILDKHGRLRAFRDDQECQRQMVSKSVNRVLKQLQQRHHPLAEHLRLFLSLGTPCRYSPDPRVDWITG